jgi:hypothetical protein
MKNACLELLRLENAAQQTGDVVGWKTIGRIVGRHTAEKQIETIGHVARVEHRFSNGESWPGRFGRYPKRRKFARWLQA